MLQCDSEVLFCAKDDCEEVRLYLVSSSIGGTLSVLLVVFGNILGSQTDLKRLSSLQRPSLVAGGHGMKRPGSCGIVLVMMLLLLLMKMLMLRISILLFELLMLCKQVLK